ncbi:hypothetical protein FBU31_000711 [Coemansia sp. 'formosensis']|nr:hypothetical protein FBU31_000711 [Coemansia sp. 'formosensis']
MLGANGYSSVFRPILWAVSFTACAYYITIEAVVYNILNDKPPAAGDSKVLDPHKVRPLSELFGYSCAVLANNLLIWWKARGTRQDDKHNTAEAAHSIGKVVLVSANSVIKAFEDLWRAPTRGECFVYGIFALNTAVFIMWGSRRLNPFMKRNFVHDPRSNRSYTLLTSMFSHRKYWHYIANSAMLVTYGSDIVGRGGPEQFTFMYLSTGVLANLVAHLSMVLSTRVAYVPLIGAGGAMFSLLGGLARVTKPAWLFAVAYMPYLVGLIPQAFPQSIGLYRPESKVGWRSAYYISHIAGAVLGIAYVEWGSSQWAKHARARRDQLSSATK